MILGVCAGIARALGGSPTWIRAAVLVLGFVAPPLTLVAYALAGVVVPREDGRMALAGAPADTRESIAAWGVAGLAALVAIGRGPLLIDGGVEPILLVAAGAVAALALSRRSTPGTGAGADAATTGGTDPATGTPAAPAEPPTAVMAAGPVDPPTAVMPAGPADPPTAVMPNASAPTMVLDPSARERSGAEAIPGAPRARRGPSLLLAGLAVLVLSAVAVVLGDPMTTLALNATQSLHLGAGIFGVLAVAGVATAIALWDHRHASGLLVLSLAVGAMAFGLAVMPEPTAVSDPGGLARAVVHRVADLLRLND